MFDPNEKNCTLLNVNGRHEMHGPDKVLAVDLKFRGDFDGDILAEFAPALRSAVFAKNEGGDLADQGTDTPTKLRFPNLIQPLKFENEVVGARVKLPYGLQTIEFETADVNKFEIECHDGGTVTVSFRVQARPTEEQMARCFALLDTQVPITTTPPEVKLADDLREAA